MIITTAGQQLAVGLIWSTVPKTSLGEEIKRQIVETGRRHAVQATRHLDGGDTVLFGLAEKDEAGAVAAAGLLLGEYDDVLYVSSLGGNRFWFCVIADGSVNKDVVVEGRKELLQAVEQEVLELKLAAIVVDVAAPDALADDVLTTAQVAFGNDDVNLHETAWRDLEAIASSPEAGARKPAWKIKIVRRGLNKRVLLTIILLLLAGAYFGEDLLRSSEPLPVIEDTYVAPVVEAPKPEKESQEVLNARAIEAAVTEEKQALSARLLAYDTRDEIGAVISALDAVPVAVSNWRLQSAQFAFDGESDMKLQYSTSRLAFVRDVVERFPGASADLAADANSVTISKALPVVKSVAEKDLDSVIGHGALTAFIDKVKAARVAVAIGEYSWSARSTPIAGLLGQDPTVRAYTPSARSVNLIGSGLPKLAMLANNLQGEENFVVETVDFSIDGGGSWKLKGVYYE